MPQGKKETEAMRRKIEKMCGERNTLDALPFGERAMIDRIGRGSGMARRLADLGFCPGVSVRCVLTSPLGDPRAYEIRGAVIALRQSDAKEVWIRNEAE